MSLQSSSGLVCRCFATSMMDSPKVLIFVEERLGPRVFVGMAEIRGYYEEVLIPRLEEEGTEIPPLDEVREEIRAVLREERLNEELDLWTEQLRQDADIVDSLDRSGSPPTGN